MGAVALKQPTCLAPRRRVWSNGSSAWPAGGTCPPLRPSSCTSRWAHIHSPLLCPRSAANLGGSRPGDCPALGCPVALACLYLSGCLAMAQLLGPAPRTLLFSPPLSCTGTSAMMQLPAVLSQLWRRSPR